MHRVVGHVPSHARPRYKNIIGLSIVLVRKILGLTTIRRLVIASPSRFDWGEAI